MLATSLTTHSRVDDELFPLLKVQCCVSEARESRNGPRFSAQDLVTGTVYEVRCRLIAGKSRGPSDSRQKEALLSAQERIDELMTASSQFGRHGAARNVLLPVDVYIQEQPSTGAAYVVSVEPFAGLSLGDIVRSGWTLVDENTFLDVLQAAEEFGKASRSLPPHGNLSTDSLKQVLMVRDGATEANCPSRWVVSDWLLTADPVAFDKERGSDQLLQDLEWLLHSCFSMLNVTSAQDGAFLAPGEVEEAINAMIDRVRHHLATSTSSVVNSALSGRGGKAGRGLTLSVSALMDETAGLTVQEKIAHHNNALRSEQIVVQRHRRKRGELPPLAQHAPPSAPGSPKPMLGTSGTAYGNVADAPEADAYEMRYLATPIALQPSRVLTLQSSVKEGTVLTGEAGPSPSLVPTRDQALDIAIDLAVQARERKDERSRKVEAYHRAQRDALRARLAPAPVPKGGRDRSSTPTRIKDMTATPAPLSQSDRSAVRRVQSNGFEGSAGHGATTKGGHVPLMTSARQATSAAGSATPPLKSAVPPPVDDGVAKASESVVARTPSETARHLSVTTHEQSPEPRPPTPFAKPILKSAKPPGSGNARFGLAVNTPKTRPQSAAVGPMRRPLSAHLTEKRVPPTVRTSLATSRGVAAPSPQAPRTRLSPRMHNTKPSVSAAVAMPAQRVERRRQPLRGVAPGRSTPAGTGAAVAVAPESNEEPVAASYPFVKPLALHRLVKSAADHGLPASARSGTSAKRSPHAQTARPRQASNLHGRLRQPHTAREMLTRNPSLKVPQLSPRSPRSGGAGGGGSPRNGQNARMTPRRHSSATAGSPRQRWNNSPRVERQAAATTRAGKAVHQATGVHPHQVTRTPRGSGSPRTFEPLHNRSPRVSGSGPRANLRSTSRSGVTDRKGSSPRPAVATQPRVTAPAKIGTTQRGTLRSNKKPVATERQPRRISVVDGTDHLSKGTVYPVNETSVGISLRLARMQSGPL